ncbi:MAG: 5-formyltetrahydrofolate cyclo-ligase [Rhodobacteraceae bacterium HLUCCA12]|nr:MAG: 5-formyltetrahydrofolate cyclo-ligase [Rhodobacteraceae bacterium HLUCCA12]
MTRNMPDKAYASSPCMAADLADPQQALEVARWRRAERARLIAARAALPLAERTALAQAIAAHLDTVLGDVTGHVIAGYWPIRGEPDLRFWLYALHAKGATLALPVVETPRCPLVFRHWEPGARLQPGHWRIPEPPADAATLMPDIVLAPLVGWDAAGYRLGHGGGYFDRTLAARTPPPRAIGVGLQSARLSTIFPQPHDIGLSAIVTEAGLQYEAKP